MTNPDDALHPLPPAAAPAASASPAEPAAAPLSAAKEAAAFVAKIFAEPVAEAPAQEAQPLAETQALAPAFAPVPQDWPAQAEQPLRGQRVLVLGLGASGLAMARWCARCGAQVTVADTRAAPPQLATLRAELPQVRFIGGAFDAALVHDQALDAIYRSPGLAPAALAPVLEAARACQVSLGGELDLYSQALRTLRAQHGYAPAVLAVTGTNGKTTVTSLTGQLVQHAGRSVAVAGNIGPTLLDTLAARIAAQDLPEVWVLELSSFQLDGVQDFEPTAAVVLNLTQDHLDWHGGMAAYGAAKARIFGQTGLMVLNREDPAVMQMLPEPVRVKLQKPQLRAHVTFGADLPQRPGDFGMETVNGMVWLVRAHQADETAKRSRLHEEPLHLQRLMPADALRIRGRHNACNALAALALTQAAGCALGAMLYGLREYRGEPHRVESIGMVGGVEYFDDSKGTNVGATVAALAGLGPERRLVVILGGDGKGQDFTPLASPMARYARAAVLIGRDAPHIAAALADVGVPLLHAASMEDAVQQAAGQAQPGDAVLMSPACASLDMFRDYAHRAQVFVEAVRALAQAQGQELEGGL
ncbi:UDP-N-acetylmuramoylalanine--D-glutamate ligase [Paenacidovorax caeni]|uniref:UDP-N-acetylmuramoylalanine--D-glutamate ligase n=1 Tax=Paenacidovorax caeni TaxID=343013 RepID=A0A1I7F8L6_9BURK|nr:UDP-N-acetylmuramoyl-L-alanine--D-glutamate ligase [Paenacidovorax caeni]SFU32520.1 UDP-N-acetylmuramoylalanine--D-glutamate ligase [Paenacidovorax caeni]